MIVNEIFRSIDGEANFYGQGILTTFIRLQGCNVRCAFCDTMYSQGPYDKDGTSMSINEIYEKVCKLGNDKVTITGGEPLFQLDDAATLARKLLRSGTKVTIETNGTIMIPKIGNVGWVVDFKLPSSGVTDKMCMEIFPELGEKDIIKFVISDKSDFDKAMHVIASGALGITKPRNKRPRFAFSPILHRLEPVKLLNWMMMADLQDSFLSVQVHKLLSVK